MMTKTVLLVVAALFVVGFVAADDGPEKPEPAFTLSNATLFGNGCPAGSVQVVPSPDGQTVSVLFSEYIAATLDSNKRDRKACNLALPLHLKPGFTIGVFQVDYRGYVMVPNHGGASARFDAEYYFAGARGPRISERWGPDTDEEIFISDRVDTAAIVWSPCGSDVNFRINSAITARKRMNWHNDVEIAIDSIDTTVGESQNIPLFKYYFLTRECEN